MPSNEVDELFQVSSETMGLLADRPMVWLSISTRCGPALDQRLSSDDIAVRRSFSYPLRP